MASGYFIGGDGKRRTFNSDGTETTPGAQPATQRPTPGSSTPNLARPVAAASPQPPTPQPGAQGTFSVMPPGTSSPMLARPSPQPGRQHQQPAVNLTRPTYSPAPERAAQASLIDPRSTASEMLRRADAAGMDARRMARSQKGMYTAAQIAAAGAAAAPERQFWLDQAASIPGGARRIGEIQAEQAGKGQLDAASQASAERVAHTESAARLAAERIQQQGAMDRTNAEGQFQLRRPQRPITLSDGSLAAPGPDGTLQPYTMPDGSPAQAMLERPQVNQTALARLVPALAEQFGGIDEYGQVADPEAPKGRRPATPEDRESAYRRAVSAARETLAGPSAPQSSQQRPATSAAPPAGSRPATLDEFLSRAREANPGYSDEELAAYFTQSYGSR